MTDFEREDSNAIICPFCGARDDDAWEHRLNSGNINCWMEECGKKFYWEREVTVEYKTKADCSLNDEEHDFEEPTHWLSDDKNSDMEFCVRNCNKCAEYKIDKRIKVPDK